MIKCYKQLLTFIGCTLLAMGSTHAQYKVETFAKFKHNGANKDTPESFTSVFKKNSQIYVWYTIPDVPNSYEGNLYKIEGGNEILKNYFEYTHFKDINNKKPTVSYPNMLGLANEPGEYKVTLKDKTKKIVAETRITVTGEEETPTTAVANGSGSIVFCEDTDDKLKPINPVVNNTINAGEGVNFLGKLNKGIGARFFIWAVFTIDSDGDETLWKDVQMDVDNETYTLFATSDKTYFTNPGKYAVYMLKQNATNTGMTVRKPKDYYARNVLTVK